MRKVFYLLGELQDRDIDWIGGAGSVLDLPPGHVLVRQGVAMDALYLVLKGRHAVTFANGKKVMELGTGEVVGELSFLDSRPPNVTVTATERSSVLAISVTRLSHKLKTDDGFASRFYRSLGILLADRLRMAVTRLAGGPASGTGDDNGDELNPDLLETMNRAAVHFETLRSRLGVR